MGMLGIYRKHLRMASLPNEKRNRQNKIETRYVSHSFCFRLRSKQTKRWLLEYKVRYHADCRHHSICTHTCFYCIATASFSFHKAYLLCLWLCFSIIFVFQSKFIARSQYYYRRSSSSSVCKFFFSISNKKLPTLYWLVDGARQERKKIEESKFYWLVFGYVCVWLFGGCSHFIRLFNRFHFSLQFILFGKPNWDWLRLRNGPEKGNTSSTRWDIAFRYCYGLWQMY